MDRHAPTSADDPGARRSAADRRPQDDDGLELAALEVGGVAAAGAVIGRILGGGARGTLLGAVVGAAAGTALSLGSRRGSADARSAGGSRDRASRVSGARRGHADPRRSRDGGSGEGDRSAAPAVDRLESWTKTRLYDEARALEIAGRSKMNKAELIEALRRHPDFSPA